MGLITTNHFGNILGAIVLLWIAIGIGCQPDASTPKEAPSIKPVKKKKSGRPPGRWLRVENRIHAEKKLSSHQKSVIKQLNAIGYLQGSVEAKAKKGVTIYDEKRASPGYNFYISGHLPEATLIDMEGNVLHRWHYAFRSIWSKREIKKDSRRMLFWRKAYLFENGDLLAMHEGYGIVKLDKNSKLIWAQRLPAHHDLQVMPNGDIYVLTSFAHMVERVDKKTPILEDYISILSSNGEEKERISLLEIFENSAQEHSWVVASKEFWKKEKRRKAVHPNTDIFHTNTLAVLDGSIADKSRSFKKGNVLLSMCHLDMIAVVDLKMRKVVWSLKDVFGLQHDPSITSTGKILLFNNFFKVKPRRSSAMIIDPVSKKTEWQYSGSKGDVLFSKTCGTTEYLPNGNVLITETDNGRALEVTRDKKVVWEFYNPHLAGENNEYIASLFELIRLPQDFDISWAKGKK